MSLLRPARRARGERTDSCDCLSAPPQPGSPADPSLRFLLCPSSPSFPLARLKDISRQVALGGVLQVGLTTAATAGIAGAFGPPTGRAAFYGFVFALSITAIGLRALAWTADAA